MNDLNFWPCLIWHSMEIKQLKLMTIHFSNISHPPEYRFVKVNEWRQLSRSRKLITLCINRRLNLQKAPHKMLNKTDMNIHQHFCFLNLPAKFNLQLISKRCIRVFGSFSKSLGVPMTLFGCTVDWVKEKSEGRKFKF